MSIQDPVSAASAQHFQYRDIEEPRQIRLIRVYSSQEIAGRIEFELSHVSLNRFPGELEYNAISYCWGDPSPTGIVWSDDNRYLRVTNSAAEILHSIVTTGSKGWFWIDALCINQRNSDEKGKQVRLMQEIYKSAKKIIAWLGEPTIEEQGALEFLGILRKSLNNIYATNQPVTVEALCRFPSCEFPSIRWMALRHFLERPWFQRVWVVQEVVAASKIVIIFGPTMADWEPMVQVLMAIRIQNLHRPLMVTLERNVMDRPSGLDIIGQFQELRLRTLASYNSLPTLEFCLIATCAFKATDPRDKIFAVLGMASDAADPEFDPDYDVRSTPESVFTAVARHMITRNRGSIGILHAAVIGFPRKIHDLPSWVPDWTSVQRSLLGLRETTGYQAAGSTRAVTCTSYNIQSGSITLPGYVVDIISSLASPKPEVQHEISNSQKRRKFAEDMLSWINSFSQLLPRKYISRLERPVYPDVIGRTIVANLTHLFRPASESYPRHFCDFLEMAEYTLKATGNNDNALIEPTVETMRSAEFFGAAFSNIGAARKMFSTKCGYLGIGPPGTIHGDLVCIFPGTTTPFIIRKRLEDGYSLVGEYYVHGIMYGEGLKMNKIEDIILY